MAFRLHSPQVTRSNRVLKRLRGALLNFLGSFSFVIAGSLSSILPQPKILKIFSGATGWLQLFVGNVLEKRGFRERGGTAQSPAG